ncbi:MAG: hypothetical protein WAT26_13975 [Saprospiraceae bacterium]
MARKNYLAILILLAFNTLTLVSQDLRKYYENVFISEKFIFQNEFDSAFVYYNKANHVRNLFLQDAYNADLTSVKIGEYTHANLYIKKMIQKGISYKYFKKDTNFINLVKSKYWDEDVFNDVKPLYNVNLHNFLLNLLEKDQDCRKSNIDEKLRIDVDIAIGRIIDSLFATYGYLSEELIGVFPKDNEHFPIGWSPLDVILIHQVKLFNSKYKDFFEKSVLDGSMENKVLAMHSTNFLNDSNYIFKCFYLGNCDVLKIGKHYFTCGEDLEILVNKNRLRIFMPPLSHSIKSVQLKLLYSDFKIGYKPAVYENLDEFKIDKKIEETKKDYKIIELQTH